MTQNYSKNPGAIAAAALLGADLAATPALMLADEFHQWPRNTGRRPKKLTEQDRIRQAAQDRRLKKRTAKRIAQRKARKITSKKRKGGRS